MAEAPEETTAPEDAGCSLPGGSTWWGGWIQAAKDKSVSALDFVKKDITEFTSTMHVDSNSLACNVRGKLNQETATAATQRVKHGMSLILDGIKTALIIPPDDMSDDEGVAVTIGSSHHIFDRAKARLHEVQTDPGTYCNEPLGPKQEFIDWQKTFDLDGKKGAISELLVSNVEVRALYTQMVPSSVSHADFWHRYFYKVNELDAEEQRRANLMKRADEVEDDNDLAWDEEDDWENMEGNSQKVAPQAGSDDKSTEISSTDTQATSHTTENTQDEHSSSAVSRDIKVEEGVAEMSDAMNAAETSDATNCTSQTDINTDNVTSPSDTVSTLSTTDSASKDLAKDSSAETLTVVSAESPSSDIAEHTESLVTEKSTTDDQQKEIKTKEKGDIIMVGENNSDRTTSPSTSETNSHNKESLDDDWEKDFDIEVTEEDIKQLNKSQPHGQEQEGEEDWENWE